MTGRTKTLNGLCFKAAGAPSAEQMQRVNGYSLAPLDPEQVYVRTAYIAHNGIDRDDEVFDDALLSDFARTLPGKGFFVRHPGGWDGDKGPGQGRWFEARIVEMSLDEARLTLRQPGLRFPPGVMTAKLLEGSFYTVRHPGREPLLLDIDAGIAGDVSVGFFAKGPDAVADGAGEVVARRWKAPGEALETSIVWLGAQPGARIHKSALGATQNEGSDMDPKLKELQDKVDSLGAELATQKAAAAFGAEIRKTLGADMTASAVIEAARNGIAAHKALVDEIVALERQQGLCGDTDEAVKAAQATYTGRDLAFLKSWSERLRKAPGGAAGEGAATGIPGGDPNASRGTGSEGKGLRNKDVTQKALGAKVA